MFVVAGGKKYSDLREPIVLALSATDKLNIANMTADSSVFAVFPEEMDDQIIAELMEQVVRHSKEVTSTQKDRGSSRDATEAADANGQGADAVPFIAWSSRTNRRLAIVPNEGDPYLFQGRTTEHCRIVTAKYAAGESAADNGDIDYLLELRSAHAAPLSGSRYPGRPSTCLLATSPEDLAQKLEISVEQAIQLACRDMPMHIGVWALHLWPEEVQKVTENGAQPSCHSYGATTEDFYIAKWDVHFRRDSTGYCHVLQKEQK